MSYFPKAPPFRLEWCPNCEKWYGVQHIKISCLVLHRPGDCCHYGETPVLIIEETTGARFEKKGVIP